MLEFTIFLIIFAPIFVAYLIGSFPTATIISKIKGVDILKTGSRNPGFTNTWRQLGFFWALPVLIIDTVKGYLACQLVEPAEDLWFLLPIAVLIGHVFPFFNKFKGGKGTATSLGIIAAIFPQALPWIIAIFLALFLTKRIMSLSVLVSAFIFPFIVAFTYHNGDKLNLAIFICSFLFITHWKNILRLMDGEENKIW
jgi:glycerol-3-phosphate acyltransferase PlsY